MTDTATPETGPVDAPASIESIVAELETGGEAPANDLETITQELVNEAEGEGEPVEGPETEDDATEPAEEAEESEEEAPQEEPTADEPTYTVKVNGEERTVPLSELLNGYSRTEDYKAKTTAVAEQRRELEAKASTIEAEVKAEYANQLEEATKAFAEFDPVLMEARKIDWAQLKATNPAAYVAAQDQVETRLAQLRDMQSRVATAREQSQQQFQAQAEQERAQRFNAAAEKIVERTPELADEAKFVEFARDNIAHLKNEGFTEAEIAETLDHRVLTLADKARRWDAYQAAQKSLPEKRVVQKSAVKALTTDGSGSRVSKPRFPANADRDRKGDWIAEQILSEL
jgi:hypothetical protein